MPKSIVAINDSIKPFQLTLSKSDLESGDIGKAIADKLPVLKENSSIHLICKAVVVESEKVQEPKTSFIESPI